MNKKVLSIIEIVLWSVVALFFLGNFLYLFEYVINADLTNFLGDLIFFPFYANILIMSLSEIIGTIFSAILIASVVWLIIMAVRKLQGKEVSRCNEVINFISVIMIFALILSSLLFCIVVELELMFILVDIILVLAVGFYGFVKARQLAK